ncbi:MAG TPA: phosphoenolpyruvate--protein phosphotransferase [Vicinamibacterales bacterium]|nr:phosphoenolpyruvate--protein phosphotransferase [Vicinamibacterales bacterium]
MQRLTGIGVSPGVAVGRAVILTLRTEAIRFPIPPERVDREVAALHAARQQSRLQLQDIRTRVQQARGAELAAIFDAQILMLDDALFVGRAEEIIRSERVNAAWAVHRAYEELGAVFASVEDPYLRERENDVADVAGRLRMNLRHGARGARGLLSELDGPSILVADELTASLAAQLDWTRIQGFALDAGSRTYHTAILARSLKVPAVVGLHDASAQLAAGTPVILDGTTGELIVDPTPQAIDDARSKAASPRRRAGAAGEQESGPAITADGVSIRLQANVELLEDLELLREHGAEGVGLYRSEFMLSGRSLASATEDAQYALYRNLIEQVAPQPVTIRTFDVDERQLSYGGERRRGRGLRGLRLGLARPELLRTQLRALVRAGAHGRLRVMFPLVTGVDEVRRARQLLAEVSSALGLPAPAVGAMVEVPAAALAADLLAPEVDFLTIGTNDLIQYCLAVDRTDDRMSEFYEPLHPSVLRLIRMVRRAARRHRVPVSLCGEMASDPALLGLLVGLGLTEFSMTPAAIPVARQAIRDIRADQARVLASHALTLATAEDIGKYLFEAVATSAASRNR